MSKVYDMQGNKIINLCEELKSITYKEMMTIIIQNATEEGCKEIFTNGGVTMCPSKVFENKTINEEAEERSCEDGIGCTKCWTNAVEKIRKEEQK